MRVFQLYIRSATELLEGISFISASEGDSDMGRISEFRGAKYPQHVNRADNRKCHFLHYVPLWDSETCSVQHSLGEKERGRQGTTMKNNTCSQYRLDSFSSYDIDMFCLKLLIWIWFAQSRLNAFFCNKSGTPTWTFEVGIWAKLGQRRSCMYMFHGPRYK